MVTKTPIMATKATEKTKTIKAPTVWNLVDELFVKMNHFVLSCQDIALNRHLLMKRDKDDSLSVNKQRLHLRPFIDLVKVSLFGWEDGVVRDRVAIREGRKNLVVYFLSLV